MATLAPQIKWCQRKDRVNLKVEVRDAKTVDIKFTSPDQLTISCASDGKNYYFDTVLFAPFDTENSSYKVFGYNIDVLIKKTEQVSWPRITQSKAKMPNIGVDWNNWVDSDEEAEEDEAPPQDFNFGPAEGDSDEEPEEPEANLDDLEGEEDVKQTQVQNNNPPEVTVGN